ncbi:hypothetical protein FKM82_027266 [Ascaphus truei]
MRAGSGGGWGEKEVRGWEVRTLLLQIYNEPIFNLFKTAESSNPGHCRTRKALGTHYRDERIFQSRSLYKNIAVPYKHRAL